MRILVIGLDGASMDLIKLWAHEGKLPTFAKLMREGSYGNLESVIPTFTIPAWNCMTTGKNPGKIGCFSFLQKAPGSYDFRVYSSLVKKEKNIWDILSNYGKKVFVFNAPNVLRAYKINGYMVAGWLCISEEKLTYPKSLREEIYNLNYKRDVWAIEKILIDDREFSRRHMEITEKHYNILLHFLKRDWDFGFVVFTELDRVSHRFSWDTKNSLLRHYQNMDRKLKQLLDKLDSENNETTIMIVSDHGFGPNKRIFLINEWLKKKGFLEVERMPAIKLANSLMLILRRPNILKILRLLAKFLPLIPLYQSVYPRTGRLPILWDKTKAFAYSTWGAIYINLRGREPQGIVKEEEYEKLRSEIIEELREISVKAYRREELYHGEYQELAPDIIVQIDDNVNFISAKVGYGKEFLEGFDGNHRRNNGTFIAWGPDIRGNFEINAKIYDIAPTILHMFGIPIPRDMDGRVLKEIFKGELAMREIKYQEIDERERIKKKIRELKCHNEM